MRTARRSRSFRRCDRRWPRRRRPRAPAARATSIVSRVDFPVVNTSSTTSTRSPGDRLKPRRSVSAGAARSLREYRAHAERARHFVADDQAAQRRRQHDRRAADAFTRAASARPERRRVGRDAAAPAPTAGSRCCEAPTTAGNAPRDSAPARRNNASASFCSISTA